MATTVLLTDSTLADEQRSAARKPLAVPGRLVWKDGREATRFASVTIRNVSNEGAYVECESGATIPLYRLVYLQSDTPASVPDLPAPLSRGRVLAAVYRIDTGSDAAGPVTGFGLRLLVEPASSIVARRPRAESTGDNLFTLRRTLA